MAQGSDDYKLEADKLNPREGRNKWTSQGKLIFSKFYQARKVSFFPGVEGEGRRKRPE